jgi:hypothetical protein
MQRHQLNSNDFYSISASHEQCCRGDEKFDSDLIQLKFRGYLAITKTTEARPAPRIWWRTKKHSAANQNARLSSIEKLDTKSNHSESTADVAATNLTDEWSRIYLHLTDSGSPAQFAAQMPSPEADRRQQVLPKICLQEQITDNSGLLLQDIHSALPQQTPEEWATCFLSIME